MFALNKRHGYESPPRMEPIESTASPSAPSIDVAVVVAEELSLPLRGVAAVVKPMK